MIVPKPTTTPIVDNPLAPDVFADGLVGAALYNGNVHMTFTSRRCDHAKNPAIFNDVVIGRLVMPIGATENMIQVLDDFVKRVKQQAADALAEENRSIQ